ncbi:MAG TPA: protein kinase [Bryobacteraceae bacterium]
MRFSASLARARSTRIRCIVQAAAPKKCARFRKGPLERHRIAAIVRQIGSALSATHALGIAHRDLKPENIMLQRLSDGAEAVKLIDFGIAKVEKARLDAAITTVMIAGTVRYMAPEQFSGENGSASDIYSLALIACEMLGGHPDVRAVSSRVNSRAKRALESALAFRPEQRPQQVRAWSDEFATALTSQTRRNFAIAAAGSAGLVAGGAFAGSRWYGTRQDTPRVVEYTAAFDPLSEGFQIHNDLVGTIVENPSRTGFDSWRVTSPRQGNYYRHLTDRQKRLALARRWKLTAVMRAEEGTTDATVDFAGRGNRFDVNILVTPGADLIRLSTQIFPERQGLDYPIPRKRPEYRRYELVYDPGLGSAALSIDGKSVLSGYRGHSQFQEDWGIEFGASLYASSRGVGTFQLVRFEINP